VRQLTKARILVGNRIVKGSFGPSFLGKEAKNANPEDAQDSEVDPSSDGGEQNNGQKQRKAGSGAKEGKRLKGRQNALGTANPPEGKRPAKKPNTAPGTAFTTCPCCGQFHRLEKCFYAFPELAPDSFVEREHIQMRVKEALLDAKLQVFWGIKLMWNFSSLAQSQALSRVSGHHTRLVITVLFLAGGHTV